MWAREYFFFGRNLGSRIEVSVSGTLYDEGFQKLQRWHRFLFVVRFSVYCITDLPVFLFLLVPTEEHAVWAQKDTTHRIERYWVFGVSDWGSSVCFNTLMYLGSTRPQRAAVNSLVSRKPSCFFCIPCILHLATCNREMVVRVRPNYSKVVQVANYLMCCVERRFMWRIDVVEPRRRGAA